MCVISLCLACLCHKRKRQLGKYTGHTGLIARASPISYTTQSAQECVTDVYGAFLFQQPQRWLKNTGTKRKAGSTDHLTLVYKLRLCDITYILWVSLFCQRVV